jgi:hypothetical protein
MQGVGKKFRVQAPNASLSSIIHMGRKSRLHFTNPQKKHTMTESEGTTTTTLPTIGIKEEEEAHRVLHAEWIDGNMKLARNLGANEEKVSVLGQESREQQAQAQVQSSSL